MFESLFIIPINSFSYGDSLYFINIIVIIQWISVY